MYIIMVYDVNEKRVNRVLKKSRQFLNWVQNSVLEGEISRAKFEKLKINIRKIINENEDSVIFYVLRDTKYTCREIIGLEKGKEELFL